MYFMELEIIASEFQNMFMAFKRHAVLTSNHSPFISVCPSLSPLQLLIFFLSLWVWVLPI